MLYSGHTNYQTKKQKIVPVETQSDYSDFTDEDDDFKISPKKPVPKMFLKLLNEKKKKASLHQPEISNNSESWLCILCKEDRKIDMRSCHKCNVFMHEECLGLNKHDKDVIMCPNCDD